ncbi:MAG: permease-like cell division protein FtsX [Zoogloeaceae bacterium]|jgi:cell division transport system permease protein|nr:permease-like cell division protein FtsX [Zoogloeaceae bacterium]
MKTWFRQHFAAFARATRRLFYAPLNTLLSIMVIGIAMTLPAAGYLLLDNLKALGASSTRVQQMSLFMETNASAGEVAEVQKNLQALLPDQWRFVSRADALQQLKASEGMAEIVSSLPKNPLPDAFIIDPADASPETLEHLSATLGSWQGVAHVQLDSAWIKRFDAFLRLGRLAVNLLAVIFAAGLVAVTFNTIRLQVLAGAEEIEVARLIGATDAFIRRPFYYSGILQGGLGGGVAVLLIFVGIIALSPSVTQLAALYGSHFALQGLAFSHVFALVACGGGLGFVGAQLSVSLALRQMQRTED